MDHTLPGILITGASGFIGSHLVRELKDRYRVFCIARQSMEQAGIPYNKNIRWTQLDIGNFDNIKHVAKSINDMGGVDFVTHFASYYDFTLKDNLEYKRTNVTGTENILKLSEHLNVKRFIFSSSLAACKFENSKRLLTEESPVDANFPYAVSKRDCEQLIKKYSDKYSCIIIRLAAVYSDWCEYPPLYVFLKTWLSKKWNSRCLGGRGDTSITYIHVNDVISLINKVILKSDKLPEFSVLIASPNGTVSHNQLYDSATRYFYGYKKYKIHVPKPIAKIAVFFRYNLLSIFNNKPFEQPWMMNYIDTNLKVDASYTNKILNWRTLSRYDILRRLMFIVEKIKNDEREYYVRNEIALHKKAVRANILVYNILRNKRDEIVSKMVSYVCQENYRCRFRHYQMMEKNVLERYTVLLFQLIAITMKTMNRQLLKNYLQLITATRYASGFDFEEISEFIDTMVKMIISYMLREKSINKKDKQEICSYINFIEQITIDELKDYYEQLSKKQKSQDAKSFEESIFNSDVGLQRITNQLEDVFLVTAGE